MNNRRSEKLIKKLLTFCIFIQFYFLIISAVIMTDNIPRALYSSAHQK